MCRSCASIIDCRTNNRTVGVLRRGISNEWAPRHERYTDRSIHLLRPQRTADFVLRPERARRDVQLRGEISRVWEANRCIY